MKKKKWKDKINGITSTSLTKTAAWFDIKNKCIQQNLIVPQLKDIVEDDS